MDVIKELEELAECRVTPCGSRVTCNPPPTDTDQDYLVAANGKQSVAEAVNILSAHGFSWEGNEHYQDVAESTFMSWRKGDVNFIVSANPDFVRRHHAATALCTRFNLLEKADRVALFQAVLYANIHGE